ncbi:MAG: RpiB/LacA/LacB family sugar-phosphate isomerase [Candidatus Levybacteria bacterium]|nr:RpiB/LacA/LacB family sugar-phosphate isomerase [Candidatus Levybacteria bacterium]
MTIFLGADHRGFTLKNQIKSWLLEKDFDVQDLGAKSYVTNDDFVEYAVSAGERVAEEKGTKGIVVCGSGAGVEIATNKVKGARCTLGQSAEQVKKAREADDVNVLAIASDFTNFEKAQKIIESFLQTSFVPSENHTRRIEKISKLD